MSSKKKKSKNKKSKNTNISNKSKQNNSSINSKKLENDNSQTIENKSSTINDLEKNDKIINSEQALQEQVTKTNNNEKNNNSINITKNENDKIIDNTSYNSNNTASIDHIESTIKETKPKNKKNIVEKENSDNKNNLNNKNNNLKNNLNTENSNIVYKKKNKIIIAIIILLIIIVLLICSTIFAFLNVNKNTFAKGVSINNIDISNLSIEEAKKIISNATDKQLILDIKLKYQNNVEFEFNPTQIDYSYNIDNSLTEAYNIGRAGNIIQNNYELLFTSFMNKNIDLNSNYNEDLLNNIIDDISTKIPGIVIEPTYYIEENELLIRV